jgi:hypothetical protein
MTAERTRKKKVRARMAVTGEKYTLARRREDEQDEWECPACKQQVYWEKEGKTLAHDHDCFERDIDPVRMAQVEGEDY